MSSTGVTVNSHYCLDELKEMALFVPVKKCCGDKKVEVSCPTEEFQFSQKDCCKDKTDYIKADIDANHLSDGTDLLASSFFALPFPVNDVIQSSTSFSFQFFSKPEIRYFSFAPPPNKVAFYIQYQSFLC